MCDNFSQSFVYAGYVSDSIVKRGTDKACTMPDCSKSSWPELNGTDAQKAKEFLEETTSGMAIYLVPTGSMVTMDYRQDRVRIFYDTETGKVVRTPQIG